MAGEAGAAFSSPFFLIHPYNYTRINLAIFIVFPVWLGEPPHNLSETGRSLPPTDNHPQTSWTTSATSLERDARVDRRVTGARL